jgi:hypothetical protein
MRWNMAEKIHSDGRVDKLSIILDRARTEARCDRRLEAMTQNRELPPDDEGKPATCMAVGCKGVAIVGGYCAGHAMGRHAHTNKVLEEQRREFESGKQKA